MYVCVSMCVCLCMRIMRKTRNTVKTQEDINRSNSLIWGRNTQLLNTCTEDCYKK